MTDAQRAPIDALVSEHRDLQRRRESISSFGRISSETSRTIAQLYEEFPYPRWLTWSIKPEGTRLQFMRASYDDSEFEFANDEFQVLVAGCGTGRKVIAYAIDYGTRATITAVNLSRSSLAHAQRMAEKHGVTNIEFVQMDLLDLPNWGRSFDIIECTGVLHHMADLTEGCRAMASVANGPGIVHVSLYSTAARQSLAHLRSKYHLTPDLEADEFRNKRRDILAGEQTLIDDGLSLRGDFFDLNRCNDLLFHPQEKTYSIDEVEEMVRAANLEFRGIESPKVVPNQFWTRFSDGRRVAEFAAWREFEANHPFAFHNLYEIWLKK